LEKLSRAVDDLSGLHGRVHFARTLYSFGLYVDVDTGGRLSCQRLLIEDAADQDGIELQVDAGQALADARAPVPRAALAHVDASFGPLEGARRGSGETA
jgi:hypothetical protein